MKITDLVKICKMNKTISRKKVDDIEWIGNGIAMYPIYTLQNVNLTDDELCKLLEGDEEYRVLNEGITSNILKPTIKNQEYCNKIDIQIKFDKYILQPFESFDSKKNYFVNAKLLKPIMGKNNDTELYFSYREENRYKGILVMAGMIPVGFIGCRLLYDYEEKLLSSINTKH